MSGFFPEQPVLFYPSLARRFGVQEALLLSVYHEFARHHGAVDERGCSYFLARRGEWQSLAPFWDEDVLATLTSSLVNQHAIEAQFNANGSIRVVLLQDDGNRVSSPQPGMDSAAAEPEAVANRPSVIEAPDSGPMYPAVSQSGSMLAKGPAPSFGGSTGWNRPKDDLERLFDKQEQRNRQLHPIHPEWKPNPTTRQLLRKQNIPEAFADSRIDEFVAYWLERDRKEVSWDHLFIRLVKKEWVKQQTRQGRAMNQQSGQEFEDKGERYQSNYRSEKRERITEAVMDLKNIDW